MKNYLKIAGGINVTPLLLQLHQNPELWNANPARLYPGSPHEHSDDIWIRYRDETESLRKGSYASFNDEHDPVWYPAYYALPAVRDLVLDLARGVGAERIGGVFLWRLAPGQAIAPHADTGWHAEYYDKFNICLQAQPGCTFEWPEAGETLRERPGDIHRFLNNTPHTVINRSDDDYLVLIVCLRTHDYNRRFRPEAV